MAKKLSKNKVKLRKKTQREQKKELEQKEKETLSITHNNSVEPVAGCALSDKKVKIIKAKYEKQYDVIMLEVKPLENNKEEKTYKMIVRFSDIKRAYNITASVPPYLILKFCKELEGKEKTLKSLGATLPDKEETSKMSGEEIQQTASFWHEYPFWESYLIENNGSMIDQETKR